MNTKEKILNVIFALLLLCLIIFCLDEWSSLDIKSEWLKKLIYRNLIISPIVLLFINKWALNKAKKISILALSCLIIVATLYLGIFNFIFPPSAWKTQTVIYKYKNSKNKTIEYQMQNIGARGYNKRTVKVQYFLLKTFMITDADYRSDDDADWIKVNVDKNELGLKGI